MQTNFQRKLLAIAITTATGALFMSPVMAAGTVNTIQCGTGRIRQGQRTVLVVPI